MTTTIMIQFGCQMFGTPNRSQCDNFLSFLVRENMWTKGHMQGVYQESFIWNFAKNEQNKWWRISYWMMGELRKCLHTPHLGHHSSFWMNRAKRWDLSIIKNGITTIGNMLNKNTKEKVMTEKKCADSTVLAIRQSITICDKDAFCLVFLVIIMLAQYFHNLSYLNLYSVLNLNFDTQQIVMQ